MVLQGDKNGVFSDVCGYDGKKYIKRLIIRNILI